MCFGLGKSFETEASWDWPNEEIVESRESVQKILRSDSNAKKQPQKNLQAQRCFKF